MVKNGNKKPSSKADTLAAKVDRVLARLPKGSFATAGGVLGGPAGAAAGAALSSITGYGDYVVSHNSILNRGGTGATDIVPTFKNGGVGANVRLTHREYVADVVAPGSQVFDTITYGISPTNRNLFPWLSSFATKFQRYKVHGMAFYYKSTSTDYDNSGVIAITVNYDPAEGPFTTMSAMMNSKFAVSTKPSMNLAAPVECDPRESPQAGYFVDHDEGTSTANLRQTHKGSLTIATQGLSITPGTSIGQLSVVYDIELMYPYETSVNNVPRYATDATYRGLANMVDTTLLDSMYIRLPEFSTNPADKVLVAMTDPAATNADRIYLLGTFGTPALRFNQAGVWLINYTVDDVDVTMGTEDPTVDTGVLAHIGLNHTLGGAETNKMCRAVYVVNALAGTTLTMHDFGTFTTGTIMLTAARIA